VRGRDFKGTVRGSDVRKGALEDVRADTLTGRRCQGVEPGDGSEAPRTPKSLGGEPASAFLASDNEGRLQEEVCGLCAAGGC
jgi:hypothetical protein